MTASSLATQSQPDQQDHDDADQPRHENSPSCNRNLAPTPSPDRILAHSAPPVVGENFITTRTSCAPSRKESPLLPNPEAIALSETAAVSAQGNVVHSGNMRLILPLSIFGLGLLLGRYPPPVGRLHARHTGAHQQRRQRLAWRSPALPRPMVIGADRGQQPVSRARRSDDRLRRRDCRQRLRWPRRRIRGTRRTGRASLLAGVSSVGAGCAIAAVPLALRIQRTALASGRPATGHVSRFAARQKIFKRLFLLARGRARSGAREVRA